MPRWEMPDDVEMSAVAPQEVHNLELSGRTTQAAFIAEKMGNIPIGQWMEVLIPERYVLKAPKRGFVSNIQGAARRRDMKLRTAIRGDVLFITRLE